MREDMLETKEAAKYLGTTENTLAQWCSAGRVPYYKLTKKRMFKKADLDNFIESTRVEAQ